MLHHALRDEILVKGADGYQAAVDGSRGPSQFFEMEKIALYVDAGGILQPDGLLRQIPQKLCQVPPVGLECIESQAPLFPQQFKIALQVEIHCLSAPYHTFFRTTSSTKRPAFPAPSPRIHSPSQ
ncbi:hypothetical protein D3C76_1409100 [compost metagenome]